MKRLLFGHISTIWYSVFFHSSSETGLLWACFWTSEVSKDFSVTPRSGANYLGQKYSIMGLTIRDALKKQMLLDLPKSNLRPTLGSLRSHWRPQKFKNKLTAALFLRTNDLLFGCMVVTWGVGQGITGMQIKGWST